MMPYEQMRMGAQILAAIFGGPGIFYVWRSFSNPADALTAVIYLAIATALAIYAGRPEQARATVRRRSILPFSRKRRP